MTAASHEYLFAGPCAVLTQMLSCTLGFLEHHQQGTHPIVQAASARSVLSKLHFDWCDPKRRQGLTTVLHLPAGPFTFTGTVAKPCWDKPSVGTL